jgi:AAA+ superfamily predicted ATPase
VGDSSSRRWQRFLDGLEVAVARRVEAAEPDAPELKTLQSSRRAVREAWTGAPDVFERVDEALDAVAAGAGLSEFETDLVAVAFAADIDPSFAVALDLLRPYGSPVDRPTIGPVLEILGTANVVPAVREALRVGSSLDSTGLLRTRGDGPFLGRTLVLPDRVAAHLLGESGTDPALLPCLLHPEPMELPGSSDIMSHWQAGSRLIWVHGPEGNAGLALAAGAAGRFRLPVVAVDLAKAPSEAHSAVLGSAVLETVLACGVLIVTGLPAAEPGALLHRLIGAHVPTVVVAETSWDPAWAPFLPPVVAARRLSLAERRELWSSFVDEVPADDIWTDLLALRVTPEEVRAVAELAGSGSPVDLLTTARRLGDATGTMRRSEVTMDDVVLAGSTRNSLEEMIRWCRHRDTVLAQGPLMGKGRGRGIAALFAGGSGTGKTLAAQAVAGSLGLDLYQVDLATVVDKYVGEAEKRLAHIFATAERLNCVLFFDEADSLFGSRGAVQDAHDRYANLEVSYLLQRLEQFDGLVILATNLRGNLDAAFTRRLHFVLTFPDPDLAGREALWRGHLRHVAALDLDDPVDVAALSSVEEITGGIVRNVVLAAAFAAHEDNEGRVAHRHVAEALGRELRKTGRRGARPVPARRGPVPDDVAPGADGKARR